MEKGQAIEKLTHEVELKDSKAATCTADGYSGDKVCKLCGTVVEKGKTIPKLTHSYVNGVCSLCGEKDPNYKPETSEPTAPTIIYGASSKWVKGSANGLQISSDAAFSDFIKVTVDGKDLSSENYTVKEGSTVVTLKASYLETLSAGEHEFAIVSKTGTATTSFTVSAQSGGQQNTQTDNSQTDNSQTGDNSLLGIVVAAAVLVLALGGMISVIILRRRTTVH